VLSFSSSFNKSDSDLSALKYDERCTPGHLGEYNRCSFANFFSAKKIEL
jgi:hypothetical protein